MYFPELYFKHALSSVLSIDSPTGFTKEAVDWLEKEISDLNFKPFKTRNGNILTRLSGKTDKNIAISSHVDTVGLVVRSINKDGSLAFTTIGSPVLATLDGSSCGVRTRKGERYNGTIRSNTSSPHVYTNAHTADRTRENMCVILDEHVQNIEDVRRLGILPGDYIFFSSESRIFRNDFIKIRFLDNKLGVAIMLSTLHAFREENIVPINNVEFIFSAWEELGFGLSSLSENVEEVLSVDMGCVGDYLTCTEKQVSICAGDTLGPMDYEMTSRLIEIAERKRLNYAVDVYPHYDSDISTARVSGRDFRGALIGPGVSASHGYERSSIAACENTFKLLCGYLLED
ncbi:MAG: M42 family metallopeptidase [Defluviitaleaceae bacterium]|nr:M42 family metallopeptidase [Defluviitaleaceae bacterium]